MKLHKALGDVADASSISRPSPGAATGLCPGLSRPAEPSPHWLRPTVAVDSAPSKTVHRIAWRCGRSSLLLSGLLALILLLLVHDRSPVFSSFIPCVPCGKRERELLGTVPFTSAAGDAISPVFSPTDVRSPSSGTAPIAKATTSTSNWSALTSASSHLRPASGWSVPRHGRLTGSQIAFERCDGKHDGVFAVLLSAAKNGKLTSTSCFYTASGSGRVDRQWRRNLMVDHCSPDGRFGVVDLSLGIGENVVSRTVGRMDDDSGWGFALSPDGSTVAFGKTAVALCCDI